MTDLRIKLQVNTSLTGTFGNIFRKVVRKKLHQNAEKLRPFIRNIINDTIEHNKFLFIPTDRQAAELGVGNAGAIDDSKISGAWRLLQIEQGGLNFKYDTASSISNSIGTIRVSLNREGLFSADISNIDTPDSANNPGGISQIPWMKWFIEGKQISGVRFSNKTPILETSRTGEGIMIRGGMWDFPDNEQNVDKLIEKIRNNLTRSLRSRGSKILES